MSEEVRDNPPERFDRQGVWIKTIRVGQERLLFYFLLAPSLPSDIRFHSKMLLAESSTPPRRTRDGNRAKRRDVGGCAIEPGSFQTQTDTKTM